MKIVIIEKDYDKKEKIAKKKKKKLHLSNKMILEVI